jgi:hypothetical protein
MPTACALRVPAEEAETARDSSAVPTHPRGAAVSAQMGLGRTASAATLPEAQLLQTDEALQLDAIERADLRPLEPEQPARR